MEHSKADIQRARNRAADMFGSDRSIADVARHLGFGRQTVSRWHSTWEKQGKKGLLLRNRGPARQITDEQLVQVEQALQEGPRAHGYETELWTLQRIADLVLEKTGISYTRVHIWRLLKRMGWSCQKPERRARERDEEEIARWIVEKWPLIKRGRKKPEQDSSL